MKTVLGNLFPKSEYTFCPKTLLGGLTSNFGSFQHHLAQKTKVVFLLRRNKPSPRQQPWRPCFFNRSPWMILKYFQDTPYQISSHSEIIWTNFSFLAKKTDPSYNKNLRSHDSYIEPMDCLNILPRYSLSNFSSLDIIWSVHLRFITTFLCHNKFFLRWDP